MTVTLGTNIASLQVQRRLFETGDRLGTVFERLSSGQRINRASHDAAGLAIADSLNAESRVLTQGIRNLNDGISYLSIADATLENLTGITTRIAELAEQAANGVYSATQRSALDNEAQALRDEFKRVVESATFNGERVLDPNNQSLRLQAGFGIEGSLEIITPESAFRAIGTGTFGDAFTLNATGTNRGIDIGDLNGDGILDINQNGIVYLGNGDGTFSSTYSFYTGDTFTGQLLDIDNDGNLDYIMGGHIAPEIHYRLGNGDGTFGANQSFALGTPGSNARHVAFGDLNADGLIDVFADPGNAGGIASVYFNLGGGSFGAAITVSAGSLVSSVINGIADLNGDGFGDLHSINTQLSNGDGTFQAVISNIERATYRGGDNVYADLNGDGNLDFLTDLRGNDSYVALGNGDGTFQLTNTITHGSIAVYQNLVDIDRDGNLDLFITDSNSDETFYYRGNGDGTFADPITTSVADVGTQMEVGDFNSDGITDFVTTDFGGATLLYFGESVLQAGIDPFSLTTESEAREALDQMNTLIGDLSADRGKIGAFVSRVDVAKSVLEARTVNLTDAESRIREADIAAESSELLRLNILQQTAAAVLGQANQQPALALQLLS